MWMRIIRQAESYHKYLKEMGRPRKPKLFNADYPQISLHSFFPTQQPRACTMLKRRPTPEGSEVTFQHMRGAVSKRKRIAPLYSKSRSKPRKAKMKEKITFSSRQMQFIQPRVEPSESMSSSQIQIVSNVRSHETIEQQKSSGYSSNIPHFYEPEEFSSSLNSKESEIKEEDKEPSQPVRIELKTGQPYIGRAPMEDTPTVRIPDSPSMEELTKSQQRQAQVFSRFCNPVQDISPAKQAPPEVKESKSPQMRKHLLLQLSTTSRKGRLSLDTPLIREPAQVHPRRNPSTEHDAETPTTSQQFPGMSPLMFTPVQPPSYGLASGTPPRTALTSVSNREESFRKDLVLRIRKEIYEIEKWHRYYCHQLVQLGEVPPASIGTKN